MNTKISNVNSLLKVLVAWKQILEEEQKGFAQEKTQADIDLEKHLAQGSRATSDNHYPNFKKYHIYFSKNPQTGEFSKPSYEERSKWIKDAPVLYHLYAEIEELRSQVDLAEKHRVVSTINHDLNMSEESIERLEVEIAAERKHSQDIFESAQEVGFNFSDFTLKTASHTLLTLGQQTLSDLLSAGAIFLAGLVGIYQLIKYQFTPKPVTSAAVEHAKTSNRVSVFKILSSVAGAIVVGLAAANPIGLTAILVGIFIAGFYEEAKKTHQTIHEIKKNEAALKLKNDEFNLLNNESVNSDKRPQQLMLLKENLKEQAILYREINRLEEIRFEAKRAANFKAVSVFGTVLVLSGIFFPPLAVAGIAVLITSAIVNIADSRSGFKFTRWLSNIPNAVKNLFVRKKSKPEQTSPTPSEQPHLTIDNMHLKDPSYSKIQHVIGPQHKTITPDPPTTPQKEPIAPLTMNSPEIDNKKSEDEGEGEQTAIRPGKK